MVSPLAPALCSRNRGQGNGLLLSYNLFFVRTINSTLLFLSVLVCWLSSCQQLPEGVQKVLNTSGRRRAELEKVILHYQQLKDPQRLRAAYYLIQYLPYQKHYSGEIIIAYKQAIGQLSERAQADSLFNRSFMADSLKQILTGSGLERPYEVDDMRVLSASFLIRSIEEAFTAWQYPWARHLSFGEFCEYLLPYKVKDEYPELWRGYFQQRYSWLADSMHNKKDMLEACKLINQDLRKWFFFSKTSQPFDFSCSDLLALRAGGCPEEAQLTTYAMRAMGIPVVMDGVPMWANRNSRHDWNALVSGKTIIPFLGSETDPGVYKVEGALPGNIAAKRAKVFRRSYAPDPQALFLQPISADLPSLFTTGIIKDVTKQYVPVQTLRCNYGADVKEAEVYYLSVFNSRDWRIIDWGKKEGNTAVFRNAGRDVAYLPVMYDEKELRPAGVPVVVRKDGTVQYLAVDSSRMRSLTIDRKYPTGDDNKVQRGQHYELLYWKNGWMSAGLQEAKGDSLRFEQVPAEALLWLHDLDEGEQERVFIYENDKIIWY